MGARISMDHNSSPWERKMVFKGDFVGVQRSIETAGKSPSGTEEESPLGSSTDLATKVASTLPLDSGISALTLYLRYSACWHNHRPSPLSPCVKEE